MELADAWGYDATKLHVWQISISSTKKIVQLIISFSFQ
jgi:hypothetical protein